VAEPKKRYEEIVKKLVENDHKLTSQRLAIAKILAESEGHPGVEKIHEKLIENFPTMSLATVYRNVMLIKSLGEVLELGFADSAARYDGNKPYPHPHVICLECRKIIDPQLNAVDDLKEEVERLTGFEILTHRLDFFGLCRQCANKKRNDWERSHA
jgi:Fur family peroxide stress response transcriptional regulator